MSRPLYDQIRHILLNDSDPSNAARFEAARGEYDGIATMNDFDKIWLLTQGGPGDSTTTITVYTYKIAFSAFDMGRTTAIAWIFVCIVLAATSPLLVHLFRTSRARR